MTDLGLVRALHRERMSSFFAQMGGAVCYVSHSKHAHMQWGFGSFESILTFLSVSIRYLLRLLERGATVRPPLWSHFVRRLHQSIRMGPERYVHGLGVMSFAL